MKTRTETPVACRMWQAGLAALQTLALTLALLAGLAAPAAYAQSGTQSIEVLQNPDFLEKSSGGSIPDGWLQFDNGVPTYLEQFNGRAGVLDLSNSRPAEGLQQYTLPIAGSAISSVAFSFYINYASLTGDGWAGGEAPICLYLVFTNKIGDEVWVRRYYNYTSDSNSSSNPNFELVPQNTWVDRTYTADALGIGPDWILKRAMFTANGWTDTSYVDYLGISTTQPTTHLVTLHPGEHGDIPDANSGADHVTSVIHGETFTPPTPVPHAGWSFTGWNQSIPATITGDFETTAEYAATIPTDLNLDPAIVAENAPADTLVGTLTGSGGSGSYTYALVTGTGDTDNAKFAITNDQLTVTGALDYEVQPTAAIRVRVTDTHSGNHYEKPFTLALTDDTTEDGDHDGLTDAEEDTATTSRTNPDTDGDGLQDGTEVKTHNTSPLLADTDGDKFDDSFELGKGWNAVNGDDSDVTAYVVNRLRNSLAEQQAHDLYSEAAIRNLHVGAPLIKITNGQLRLQLQLQKSDGLNAWTDFRDPVEWSDTVSDKAFYRLFFDSTKP